MIPVPENTSPEQVKSHLCDSSRALADLTSNMVINNPLLLKPLVDISLSEPDPMAQRAAHVVSICCCQFPGLFEPYASKVLSKLPTISAVGALRNYLKIFAEVPVRLTAKEKTKLLNLGFDYLTAGQQPVSILVYSMDIAYRFSLGFPEIQLELYHIIESRLADSSAGFKSRGKRLLKKIKISSSRKIKAAE